MNVKDNLHVAFANMRANKMRSLFSMLGIVIGTGAVILVISIVNGTREATLDQIKAGKEDMLILRASYNESTGRFGKITLEDIDKIRKLPHIKTAFPDVIQETEARGNFGKSKVVLFGVDHFYTELYQHQLVSGRFFTAEDTRARPRICLVSDAMVQKLYGFDYPIGQRVRTSYGPLEVVGVFKSEERLKRMDQYGDILVPLYTALQLLSSPTLYSVQIRAMPGKVDQARNAVQGLMSEGGRLSEGVELADIRDYFKETEKWSRMWLIQMALISSISLLVGGIGLMNVMLTTVAERTHEIGLRKALGADSNAVMHQFLVESVLLSGVGGVMGVLIGVLLSYSLTVVTRGKVLVSIMPISLVVSFGFSIVTGVIFGLFPASKAAHLSPVEALRYE